MNIQIEMHQCICPTCGMPFAFPERMSKQWRESGQQFYCPAGHSVTYGESENDKLRRERDRLKQEQARITEQWNAAELRAALANRREAQLRRRVANGVCPCCKRSFSNIARHMKTKHPDYKGLKVAV
jgi:hypothetical protein